MAYHFSVLQQKVRLKLIDCFVFFFAYCLANEAGNQVFNQLASIILV
jgi:hypothetical protein